MYNFTFSINQNDLFKSTLNYNKRSYIHYFDLIFTSVALFIAIFNLFTGNFFNLTTFQIFLLIFCCILFPIINPIIIYIKSVLHANKLKNIFITMNFNEDNINIYAEKENITIEYKDIYDCINYKDMIVIMYDSIHGQIMPERIFNNKKDEFYCFISEKIKTARLKNEQNST